MQILLRLWIQHSKGDDTALNKELGKREANGIKKFLSRFGLFKEKESEEADNGQ